KFRHAYILSSTSPLRKAARALPRPADRRRAAPVELGHPRVVEQLAPGPLERDPSAVEDSAPVRVRQAGARILLDEEQRVTVLLQAADRLEDDVTRLRLE